MFQKLRASQERKGRIEVDKKVPPNIEGKDEKDERIGMSQDGNRPERNRLFEEETYQPKGIDGMSARNANRNVSVVMERENGMNQPPRRTDTRIRCNVGGIPNST